MVFIAKRQIREERDDNAIPAVVSIPTLHVHNCRRDVLREVCTYHSFTEDCEFFNTALLRSCKAQFLSH